jgi:hypothetical protein
MVLAAGMKRLLFMFTGGLLFAVIAFVFGSLVTNWYGDHAARSDDDINASVGVFLVLWPLFIGAGAYLGHRVHSRLSGDKGPHRE